MNTTDPVDLEALRGHTPGPWFIPSTMGSYGGVVHASGYVCFTAIPRNVDEARQPGESWIDMRARTQQDRDAIAVEESTNARLIASAPALLAELTARRARDAEVEVLVYAAQCFFDAQCSLDNREAMGPNADDHDVLMRRRNVARRELDDVLVAFTGAKP